MAYLIVANFSLLLFYLLYVLLLKRLTFFQWNRVYLLGSLLFSFLLPLIWYVDLDTQAEIYNTLPTVYMHSADIWVTQTRSSLTFDQVNWYLLCYGLGCLLSTLFLVIRLIKLRRMVKRQLPNVPQSFTLFHKIYVDKSQVNYDVILRHELIHAQQGHSYDLLLVELLRIFNWFNPIIYGYYAALKFQHECLADQYAATNKLSYAQILVAQAMDTSSGLLINSFSTNHQLKKRITMLFKKESRKVHLVKYVLIIPFLFGITAVVVAFNRPTDFTRSMPIETIVNSFDVLRDAAEVASINNQKASLLQLKDSVNNIATPVNGMQAYRSWIGDNFRSSAVTSQKDSLIIVRFTVEKDGRLSHYEQINDQTTGGNELIRLLKEGRNWVPKMENGNAVASSYTLPVRIKIDWNERTKIMQETTDNLFSAVEHPPMPIGGMDAFTTWLSSSYLLPKEAIKAGVKGKLLASFIVDKQGNIQDIEITDDLGYGTGEAYLALLRQAKPWTAGVQNGRMVRVKFTLPMHIGEQ